MGLDLYCSAVVQDCGKTKRLISNLDWGTNLNKMCKLVYILIVHADTTMGNSSADRPRLIGSVDPIPWSGKTQPERTIRG